MMGVTIGTVYFMDWTGVMDWSHGVDFWSGTLELNFEWNRKLISGGSVISGEQTPTQNV